MAVILCVTWSPPTITPLFNVSWWFTGLVDYYEMCGSCAGIPYIFFISSACSSHLTILLLCNVRFKSGNRQILQKLDQQQNNRKSPDFKPRILWYVICFYFFWLSKVNNNKKTQIIEKWREKGNKKKCISNFWFDSFELFSVLWSIFHK